MDIKKVNVVAFAIKNRFLGYKLLQNPRGSSPYYVKMIRTWSGINQELDRYNHYYTKSRDFSKQNEHTQKQTLLVERLMFWKSKNDKKVIKEAYYTKTKSDGEFVAKNKLSNLTTDEIMNRDTSYINKILRKGYQKELIPFCFIPMEHNVPITESIADKEISNFFRQKHKQGINRKTKSFWNILRSNLQLQ